MKIVVIDNYDSFTYNLVHAIKKISGLPVDVFRNDEIALESMEQYNKIVLSPGPGIPEEAGLLLDIIRRYGPTKSMLGVCLGHQCIGQAYGGVVKRAGLSHHPRETLFSRRRFKQEGARRFRDLHPQVSHVL